MEHCIPTQDHRPKHPRISQQIWELIERRTEARKRQDREETNDFASRSAAESEDTIDARDKWRWIKRIRSDYKPRTVTLSGPDGKPTSFRKQADTFAKHLE